MTPVPPSNPTFSKPVKIAVWSRPVKKPLPVAEVMSTPTDSLEATPPTEKPSMPAPPLTFKVRTALPNDEKNVNRSVPASPLNVLVALLTPEMVKVSLPSPPETVSPSMFPEL